MLYSDESKTILNYPWPKGKAMHYKDTFYVWEEFDEANHILFRINLRKSFLEKYQISITSYSSALFILIFSICIEVYKK